MVAVQVTEVIPELAVTDSRVPEGVPVALTGTVEAVIGGVTVAGVLRAPFEGTCRRCLEKATGELIIQIDEVCTDHPDTDLEYAVGTDWLDLEPMVHDACILELPLAPLCADDCKGLCPECGVNRNHESCSCEALDPSD